MRVGASSAAASDWFRSGGASRRSNFPAATPASSTLRTSEKPLLWSPFDASPIKTSPCAMRGAVDHLVALDHAHPEAHQLELGLGIEAGHARRLAAEQRAARALAALGDAAQGLRPDLGVELAHREVVEEHERLGALHDQVVHDHRHAVDADRVVAAEQRGELQLGADAVRRGDQHRVLVALGRLEQARRSRPPRPAAPADACSSRSP